MVFVSLVDIPDVVASTLSPTQVINTVQTTFNLVYGILGAVFCNRQFGLGFCPTMVNAVNTLEATTLAPTTKLNATTKAA
jgi:hypothetical protein